MDMFGINIGHLIIQLIVFGVWPLLAFFALLALRRAQLPETSKALWALLIVVVPIFGALAFFIVKPGKGV